MSRAARGTKGNHGSNIRQKSGLNRSLRDSGLSELLRIAESEAAKLGIRTYEVWASGSSQTCSTCGHRHRDNRKSQAAFRCLSCGYQCNADTNAARIHRNRAYHLACAIADRLNDSGAPTGWRVKSPLSERDTSTKSVYKPKGGSKRHNAVGRGAQASGSATQGQKASEP